MRVSHETIYTSVFVQAKGGLPGQLTIHLRTRRVRRRPHPRVFVGPRRIGKMVHISQRPAEVALRIVAGHWEGDLVVGQRGGSHVGTLVERSSRYLVLLHLPDGAGTDSVINALIVAIEDMLPALRKSVTWDRGIEFTRHLRFSEVTGVPVFFRDARSPWQRGTNGRGFTDVPTGRWLGDGSFADRRIHATCPSTVTPLSRNEGRCWSSRQCCPVPRCAGTRRSRDQSAVGRACREMRL